ncbi:hypothetical protein [Nitratireductor sp. OM-1]|uniref:hypothetical protein n=1 Tax=Nitratireductor sp. OM-1 TaxID=1756988 RepID=UPI0019551F9D|nr:hypothetical protein [Nitratireductor sp. OM-1]
MATTGKQLFTTLEADGTLTVALENVSFADPAQNQVLVRMEAAPINPSDLAILVGGADMENADYSPGKFVARMPEAVNSASKARHGLRLPAGNEGAGTVIAAGDSEAAQALMGGSASPASRVTPTANTASPTRTCASRWATIPPKKGLAPSLIR